MTTPRRGAFAAPAWAGSQRVGDVGIKATLLILANYADEAFSCFPSQQTLADETEQSVRTIRRQIDVLREVGLLKSERRVNDQGHRMSDRHYLQLDVVVCPEDVGAARARVEARIKARKRPSLEVIVSPGGDGGLDCSNREAPRGHLSSSRDAPNGQCMASRPTGHQVSPRTEAPRGQTEPSLEAKTGGPRGHLVAEELPDRTPIEEDPCGTAAASHAGALFLVDGPGPVLPTSKPERIPEDFAERMTPQMRAIAASDWPLLDIDAETENFVDWWMARGGIDAKKLDWVKTWKVWMRREHKEALRRQPRNRVVAGQRSPDIPEGWG